MRTNPYTHREYFEAIKSEMKKQEIWPDIFEYVKIKGEKEKIIDYHFDTIAEIEFGSVEGAFLILYFSRNDAGYIERTEFAVFRIIDASRESMRKLGQFTADFLVTEREFVNRNIDDFQWRNE